MKTLIVVICLFTFVSNFTFAQSNNNIKGRIGISYSTLGNSDAINSAHSTMAGEASYYGNNFHSLGICYIHPLTKWFDIESGIEFSKYNYTVDPMEIPGSGINTSSYEKDIQLINIPVTARINFFRYVFVNGGIILDIDTSTESPIDSQTGLGSLLGIGAQYQFKNRIGIFANGYQKFHALVSTESEASDHRWRVMESGVRFGVTYGFR